jgi:glycosyltransferase involved in cell wall biosynthesis
MQNEAPKIMVCYLGRRGGGPLFSIEMARALKDKGARVSAIVSRHVENLDQWQELGLEQINVINTFSTTFEFIVKSVLVYIIGFRRVAGDISLERYDLIYIPMTHPWVHFVLKYIPGRMVLFTVHDPIPQDKSGILGHWYDRWLAQRCSDIAILSKAFIQVTKKRFGKSVEKIHVIPHGPFSKYINAIDGDRGGIYSDSYVNFVFFGRFCQYKGLDILANAYRIVKENEANISLTVVGSGDFKTYESHFRGLDDLKVINRWIPDAEVGKYFMGKNVVVVLPYTNASQSGVIPIALDAGAIVIASRIGGIPEQIRDGETGFLCRPGDVVDLARLMQQVAVNNTLMSSVRDRARQEMSQHSWSGAAEKIIKYVSGESNVIR